VARLLPLKLTGTPGVAQEVRRGPWQWLVDVASRLNGTHVVNEVHRADLDLLFDSTFL
jgi:hypothetical protein